MRLAIPRILAWVAGFLLLSLSAAACSPDAATASGERGTDVDELTPEATPEPTVDFAEVAAIEPGVVIAPPPTPEGPRPLVVATLMGETGVMAPLDGPALGGVIAEIERMNEDGGLLGREIVLQRFDTNSRASLSERQASRLAENPPDLIIASCDTEFSQPVLDIADQAGIMTVSPCADDPRYLTGALGSRNFTLGAPAEPRGEVAAKVAIERYGTTAIVLRDVTSPEALAFCDGFERAFRELGGSVTYRDEFSYDTLEPVQDRLAERADEPSFITLCSHVPGGIDAAPSIILILRTLGFQAPIIAGSSVDEPGWFADVPTLGELVFVSWSSAFGNDPDDRINDVVRRVQQNGESPGAGVSTILGAEQSNSGLGASRQLKTHHRTVSSPAIGSFSNERFASGNLSFLAGARMDLGRTYRVLEVIDGELSVIALEETVD